MLMKSVSDKVGVDIDHINTLGHPDIVFHLYEWFESGGLAWDYVSQEIGNSDTVSYLFLPAINFWHKQWDYEWQRYRLVNEEW